MTPPIFHQYHSNLLDLFSTTHSEPYKTYVYATLGSSEDGLLFRVALNLISRQFVHPTSFFSAFPWGFILSFVYESIGHMVPDHISYSNWHGSIHSALQTEFKTQSSKAPVFHNRLLNNRFPDNDKFLLNSYARTILDSENV